MANTVAVATKIMGASVYTTGFPCRWSHTDTTSSVTPATSWLVVPNSGHRIKPPLPPAWVTASRSAAPMPRALAA